MKRISARWFARVSLIITVAVAGMPLAAHAAPEVVAWGWQNNSGQTTVPGGLSNVVAIAAGYSHSLALTAQGQIVAWGQFDQTTVPTGLSNVVAISAGYRHSLGLTADGQVVSWGYYDQTTVPGGLNNVVGIAAGGYHSLALTAQGQVVAWGDNQFGNTTVPSGMSNVVAIAVGFYHSLALTANGRVVAWGDNRFGNMTVPGGLSNVVAVAAGYSHSLALTADGRVMAWGMYTAYPNQTAPVTVPSGLSNVVAIAAGVYHNLALTADGRVVAWGSSFDSPTTVPGGLSNVVAIAAGFGYSLALTGLPPGAAAPAWVGPHFLMAAAKQSFNHRIIVQNGASAYGAAGLPSGLVLDPLTGLITGQPAQAGKYDVVLSATNSVGSCQWSVTLFVNQSAVPGISSHGLMLARLGNAFGYAVMAYNAPDWYGASGLPAGLVINAKTGVISGVPVEGGDYVVSLVASNRFGLGTGSLTLRVSPVGAWGDNSSGQTDVPSGLSNVVAISAGASHSLALTAEGRVVSWGALTTVPSGLSNVVAIAAGYQHSLALTAEGQVMGWGNNEFGQTTVPSGLVNVVAIAAGGPDSLALTADGQVMGWGTTTVPSDLNNVVAIAAGGGGKKSPGMNGCAQGLALTADGRVAGWGWSFAGLKTYGIAPVPSDLRNVVAIAAGGWALSLPHCLALVGLPPGMAKPAWVGPQLLVGTVDRPFYHRLMARNGITAYGAAGLPPGLALDPNTGLITGQPAQTGKYSLTFSATNSLGSCEWTVTLFVNGHVPAIDYSGLVRARFGSDFSYAVVADNAPEWYGASGLPAGLVMDARTGVISGVPAEFGDFVVSLVASNRFGLGTGSLTLQVSPIVAWGSNSDGQTTVPGGLSNVVAIAGGGYHSLALTAEGRVIGWGYNVYGQTNVPSGLSNAVAIAAGESHDLALTAEGRVVAWGNGSATNVPSGLNNVVAIAAGFYHSLALTSEGQVAAWGENFLDQTTLPSGLSNVVAIAAGDYHSLALTAEGRVAAWGLIVDGQPHVPNGLSNVLAIAGGNAHSLVLMADGLVVSWGSQTNVPGGLSNVVAIAAGGGHSLALTSEGRVVIWGDQTDVPGGLSNVVGIAAGGHHSLALLRQPTVPTPRLVLSRAMSGLELQAQGTPGISCLLLRASRLPGPWLPAEPVTFTNSVHRLRSPDASEPAQFFRLLRK